VSGAWKKVCRLVKARARNRCEVCGAAETFRTSVTGRRMSNLVTGHRIPPERYGGSPLDAANLFCLCRACNASQGNRTVEEWRAAQTGRLVALGLAQRAPRCPSQVITRNYTKRTEA
jgi:hypothetical protein